MAASRTRAPPLLRCTRFSAAPAPACTLPLRATLVACTPFRKAPSASRHRAASALQAVCLLKRPASIKSDTHTANACLHLGRRFDKGCSKNCTQFFLNPLNRDKEVRAAAWLHTARTAL